MLTSSPAGGGPHGSAESPSGLPSGGTGAPGRGPNGPDEPGPCWPSWPAGPACLPPSRPTVSVLPSEARLRNIYQILPDRRECVLPFPRSADVGDGVAAAEADPFGLLDRRRPVRGVLASGYGSDHCWFFPPFCG